MMLCPQQVGSHRNVHLLLADLKACSRRGDLERGKQVAVDCGQVSNIYVANALIHMYAKCGSMGDAHQVFDNIKHPDVVSWNVLILGYADNGQGLISLNLFARMNTEGLAPDSVTTVAALKACSSLIVKGGATSAECRDRGKAIHVIAADNYCGSSIYVQNSLVDMYAKCGSTVDARELFDQMKHPNLISWNALIFGYANNGQGYTSLKLLTRMKIEGQDPDSVTFLAALKACISFAVEGDCRDRGKALHSLIVETGCLSRIDMQCTIVDMYAKCGSMVDARDVFEGMKHPDAVSWNVLILGYADNGQGHIALDLFTKIVILGRVLDPVTYVAAIKSCTSLGWVECRNRGKAVHNLAMENACTNGYVNSTLINMYAKCSSIVHAREVFDGMKHPNAISWTALILGYVENGEASSALDLFTKMRTEGPPADCVTFVAVFRACGLLGALEFGRKTHLEMRSGNDLGVRLVTCLVDFYAKCGSLGEAQSVFDSHAGTRDETTWNALLTGFSSSGDDKAVFELFNRMQDAGLRPNGITFVCILNCCSHTGLVKQGKEYFEAMSTKYGIVPTLEHYNCMIDLLGRANKLDDAMSLLERMPYSPNDVIWTTILGACRKWNNAEMGKLALQSLNNLHNSNR